MTTTAQVKCINKRDRQDPHERIKNIGGTNSDGSRWKMTEENAIDGIESGKYSFFVEVRDDRVQVIVASRNGRKYLKTENDGETPNNLLSLPECP